MITTVIDRTQTVAGPCMITHDGATYIFEDAVTVTYSKDYLEIKANGFTKAKTLLACNITVAGKPVGLYTNTGKTFGFATRIVGSMLFGADKPLLIQPYDTTQQQMTLATAAITKMPDLNFTAGGSLFDGDIEWTCLGKNATLPSDVAYRYVMAANAFVGDGYDATKLIVQPYDVTHPALNGGNPFDTEAGVKIVCNVTTTDRPADSVGKYNVQFSGMTPTATFIPIGVNPADVRTTLALQGPNAVRGSRLGAVGGGSLKIVGDGVYFELPGAGISAASDVFSSTAQRVGQITMQGNGQIGGAGSPFFILGTAAPV